MVGGVRALKSKAKEAFGKLREKFREQKLWQLDLHETTGKKILVATKSWDRIELERKALSKGRTQGFPGSAVVKNLPAKKRRGLISELTRSPGEGNDNPLQYSWLGNPTDKGAWQAIVHGVAKESNTTQRLNNRHQRQNRGERCQSEARGLLKERFETQMEWRL